jgi:hypothetical protein
MEFLATSSCSRGAFKLPWKLNPSRCAFSSSVLQERLAFEIDFLEDLRSLQLFWRQRQGPVSVPQKNSF